MEPENNIQKVLKQVKLEFAKHSQQANCSFEFTKQLLKDTSHKCLTQEVLYDLIKIEAPNRNQWMVQTLIGLTRKYGFFQTHSKEAEECCKYLQYKRFPAHSEIITYGADPDYFYILMEGEASIFIKKTNEEIQEDYKKADLKAKDETLDVEYDVLDEQHFVDKNVCKFKFSTVLYQGDSFGELGMLYNRPRMATVVAKTVCVLGALKKKDYLSIFFQQEKFLRNRKKNFITDVVLTDLKNLRYEAMQGVLYRFEEKSLKINDFLFKEGDPFKTFYIVYEGELLLFYLVGRLKKPVARIGQGGIICAEQLKTFLNTGEVQQLKYSAQVCSSEFLMYKLEAQDVLKIFDYKEIFGYILNSVVSQTQRQDFKQNKSVFKYAPEQPVLESPKKVFDAKNIKLFLKNQMLSSIPQASKEAVTANRIKKAKQRCKESSLIRPRVPRVSNINKFKLTNLIRQRLSNASSTRHSGSFMSALGIPLL